MGRFGGGFTRTIGGTRVRPSGSAGIRFSTVSLILAAAAALFLFGCPGPYDPDPVETAVTGVTLDKATLSLAVGATGQLTAAVTPAGADDQSVTWSSSSQAIASVSAAGLVTGVAAGNAVITVTTTDGGFTATCAVTVSAGGGTGEPPAEGIRGILDTAFNSTGAAGIPDFIDYNDGRFQAVVPLSSGKILAAGYVSPSSSGCSGILARFNADGSLDMSFGSSGVVLYTAESAGGYSGFYGAVEDAGGNIYLAGRESERFAVWKYLSSGVLDTSFSSANADGIAGVFIPTEAEIASASDKLPFGMALGIGIDDSGRIVAGGYANEINTDYWAIAVRLNTNGTLDTSYGTDGLAAETRPGTSIFSIVSAGLLDDSGRMVLTGYWSPESWNYPMYPCVWRFTSAGTPDGDFGTNGVAVFSIPGAMSHDNYPTQADCAASDSTGYYIAGTYRKTGESYDDAFVVKLASDGSVNPSFGTSGYAVFTNIGGASSDIDDKAYAVLSDGGGKLYLAGSAFSPCVTDPEYCDEPSMFLMRLDSATGVIDTGFGSGGPAAVYGLLGGYEEEDSGTVYSRGKDEACAIALYGTERIIAVGASLPAIMSGETNISVSNTHIAPFVALFK